MNVVRLSRILGLSLALAVFFSFAGCSEGPDVSEAVTFFDENPLDPTLGDISTLTLAIAWDDADLATAGLTADGEIASFSAGGGKPPYDWDVHDVSLGTIIQKRGAFAVYQRNAPGDNVLILKDSAGNRAYAVIAQP